MGSWSASLTTLAAVVACGGTAPPDGPPHECTYFEAEVRYAVGGPVPPVDVGQPLVGSVDHQCFPSGIVSPDEAGAVACVMFVTLRESGDESTCKRAGFNVLSAEVLETFRARSPDASPLPMCLVPQLLGSDLDAAGSCANSSRAGWCYVTGAAAEGCQQTIFVSPTAIMAGAEYMFQCGQGC